MSNANNTERSKNMSDNNNRVLGRVGARFLTEEEVSKVNGSLGTDTVCTCPSPSHPNGDGDTFLGEC